MAQVLKLELFIDSDFEWGDIPILEIFKELLKCPEKIIDGQTSFTNSIESINDSVVNGTYSPGDVFQPIAVVGCRSRLEKFGPHLAYYSYDHGWVNKEMATHFYPTADNAQEILEIAGYSESRNELFIDFDMSNKE